MKHFYLKATFASLALCGFLAFGNTAQAQPSNDDIGDPALLSNDEGCGGDGSYSNIGATPDEDAGSCSPGAANANVWFEFEADEDFARIDVRVGGSQGTMRYATVTLWNDGLDEIDCATFTSATSNVVLTTNALNPGDTYFVSVDCLPGYEGTFNFCIDTETNALFDGAETIPALNTCYNSGAFTTVGAVPDEAKPGCWYYGPLNNVWFVFTATTLECTVTLQTQGGFGTMRYPMLSLQDDLGGVLDCDRFSNGGTKSCQVSTNLLFIGETYYVNVDNAGGAYKQGSFTLCFDDGPGGDKLAMDPMEAIQVEEGFETVVFPNPTSEVSEVYVKGAGEMEDVSVQLMDLTGKRLRNIELPNGIEYRVGVETQDLAPGVYMIVVQANGHRQVQRLVKN